MTSISNDNVRFFTFFKLAMLTLPGMIAYVATIIPAKYGTNCLILSLFLMLCLAFIYVILLYIVYTKLHARWVELSGKGLAVPKNMAVSLVYVVRMAVRGGILLFILTEASRELVLRKYGSAAIAVPILIAAVYMGSKGFAGFIRFSEAVFWFTLLAGLAICATSLVHLDLSELVACTGVCREGSFMETASRVMTRGGLLFQGYFLLEFVMPVYMRVKNRRRGMLVVVVITATVIGLIGSFIVTSTLGFDALASGEKNLLYIVGALELPGGVKVRPLILVCYLLLVFGVSAVIPHVICGFAAIDGGWLCGTRGAESVMSDVQSGARAYYEKQSDSVQTEARTDENQMVGVQARDGMSDNVQVGSPQTKESQTGDDACKADRKRRLKFALKVVWCLAVYSVFLWLHVKSSSVDMYRFIPGYIALVDIPLSILLPAFVIVGSRPMKRAMAGILALLVTLPMLSGCAYSSIEDVDYANVVIIQKGEIHRLRYTMVITGIDEKEEAATLESTYTAEADSFVEACEDYNAEHSKQIDTSHVEYIVAEDESILDMAYAELTDEFLSSYVTVVVEKDILEKAGDNNTKEFLKTHYEGRCLAALRK